MAGTVERLAADGLLGPLWKAAHARLCRGGAGPRSVITVAGADPDVRRAVDRLLGRVSGADRCQVRLAELDAALARAGTSVADVVTSAVGPVVDHSALRAERREATDTAWAAIEAHPTAAEPPVRTWLQALRDSGRLDRAGGASTVLAALDVLSVLPFPGLPTGRAVLAAALVGDEHGLDDNTRLGRLVIAGLAARLGASPPEGAAARAALWLAAGVSVDNISSPVLTLGLRPRPSGPLTEAAAGWAQGGVPLPVPAAALAAERWSVPAGTEVFVCENPSIVEAASGLAAVPVVCVSGMPGRAAGMLLGQLQDSGARLRYHGDFGAGGLTIANLIVVRYGAAPWRMTTADHERAVERLAGLGRAPNRLRGRVPAASWDPRLAGAITSYGREVTEEHVLDELLEDLAGR